jgi:redox-sensitive bicupin YhaK (pirin superfamily)
MSNLAPTATVEACVGDPAVAPVLEALPGRLTELGGLAIRRLLPRSQRRLVGPWCFLDSFGPLTFSFGRAMDVAPHPHIGLQTVSWLLDGEVLHNDSLGLRGVAAPGVLNLMTAGSGIAHAEETPSANSGRLMGLQLWIALPEGQRGVAPAFAQHRALPSVELDGGRATIIIGESGGLRSPARTFSPIVGVDVWGEPHRRFVLPLARDFEHALVLLQGGCSLDGQSLSTDTLYYLGCRRRELILVSGPKPARALLLGGAPFGETVLMWWNFVARSNDEIVAARDDWEAGRRFGEVRAYSGPRVPAPPFLARGVPRS